MNTIVLAQDVFTYNYQYFGVAYSVPSSFNLDKRIQFTMAHEFGHVLADAIPIALKVYKTAWNGGEENMVNELALQTIAGGGSQFAEWAFNYGL